MKDKYDVVVIGSGLGGLVSALILAKHGYSVCVLEKNRQIGGNLQTFSRDKKIFDTGVHYIGALDEGQNLNQIFKYLGIMDELKIEQMDKEGFDVISMPNKQEISLAQSYDLFKKKLTNDFPLEKSAIESYCEHMLKACDSFPLYRLIGEKENIFENIYVKTNARDLIASLTSNKDLQNVLAGNNFLYEGIGDSTPFHVHALVVNSYIESSWRMIGGGSQISIQLTKQLRKFGADIFKRTEVKKIITDLGETKGVMLHNGNIIDADIVISNAHPVQTLEMLETKKITPAFKNRVNSLENTFSAFSVHLVLKENELPYFNKNFYDFQVDDVWKAVFPNQWPGVSMISTSPSIYNQKFADNLSVMTYMSHDEVLKWSDTFNTTLHPSERGSDYEEFKQMKIDRVVKLMEMRFPNLRKLITAAYASGPLAYRDYIGSSDGSMYGIRRDYRFPEKTFIGPKTKVKNLYLTGQNLSHLHGILGVSIAGISTCSEILGLEELTAKIREA